MPVLRVPRGLQRNVTLQIENTSHWNWDLKPGTMVKNEIQTKKMAEKMNTLISECLQSFDLRHNAKSNAV